MQLRLDAYLPKEASEMAADVFLPARRSVGFPTINRGPARPGGKDMLAHTDAGLFQAGTVTNCLVVQRIVLRGEYQRRRNA